MGEDRLLALHAKMYREAAPERLEREDFIRRNRHKIFLATVRSERRLFRVAEKNNIGPGWGMAGLDYPHQPHIVSDMDLEDIEVLDDEP